MILLNGFSNLIQRESCVLVLVFARYVVPTFSGTLGSLGEFNDSFCCCRSRCFSCFDPCL
jgi:hypothetical protein